MGNKRFCDLKVGDKIYLKDENIKELEISETETRESSIKFLYLHFTNGEWLAIAKHNFKKDFLTYLSSEFNHISFSTSMDRLLLECE